MFTQDIFTDRLVLKSMKQDHASLAWSIWGDFEQGKYLHDPYYETPQVLWELFEDIDTWSDYSFIAFNKSTDEFIGTCSIGPEETDNEWGIGYCVRKEEWGKGYASEMGKALIGFGYSLGIKNFTGTVAEENRASGQVMENCGFKIAKSSSFKKKNTNQVYKSNIYKMTLE